METGLPFKNVVDKLLLPHDKSLIECHHWILNETSTKLEIIVLARGLKPSPSADRNSVQWLVPKVSPPKETLNSHENRNKSRKAAKSQRVFYRGF